LAFTFGRRYDQFDPRPPAGAGTQAAGVQRSINPRVAVSTVLKNATFVASVGRFSQPPDFQYLVDASFDDTLRTGRFRRGNPSLGFEAAVQYEFSVRMRPTAITAVRVNLYVKRLDGLVAAAIFRYNSGLPYTRTNATGDTLIGLPNSYRLPAEKTLDLLVRRPLSVGGLSGGMYLDVRNLFNWRNLESVRRDTGTPG